MVVPSLDSAQNRSYQQTKEYKAQKRSYQQTEEYKAIRNARLKKQRQKQREER